MGSIILNAYHENISRRHANITTTYLKSTPLRLERALQQMDAVFAHDSHKQEQSADAETAPSMPTPSVNSQSENELEGSGPPGDRTRDTVIKSHVLYH